jgi:protease I
MLEPAAINLIKVFDKSGKSIAAICHGPWTLIVAEVVKGLTVTSWPSLRADRAHAHRSVGDLTLVTVGTVVPHAVHR